MKVLVSDSLSSVGLEILRSAGIEVDDRPGVKGDELHAAIRDADGLAIRSGTKVTAELLAHAEQLKVVGRAGIGVDNVDLAAATERGIVVMNTPGGNTVTTAEHTISLMMSLARKIPQGTATLKAGQWAKSKLTGVELEGKTLGLVGVGSIGSIVADRARGLKMKVVGYDPFLAADAAKRMGVELVTLDELFARADVISVHTPLTDETRGIVGREALTKTKPGVLVVNCARGGIVDEEALAEALSDGRVWGAALDVFAEEPPPADHPLLALDNVVCTPHLGASTTEAGEKVGVMVAEQIRDYLLHGVVRNAVNVPAVAAEDLPRLKPYLTLAERLGAFLGQMAEGAPKSLALEYFGEAAELNTAPLTNAFLRGFLTPQLDVAVNDVNAAVLARERGLQVADTRSSKDVDFTNLLQARLDTDSGSIRVAGAVLGAGHPRLVRIDDFFLEAILDGCVIVLHNEDVPGVVGRLGTLLGEEGINIAGLQLGRDTKSGHAVSLFHVDQAASRDVLERIRKAPNILSARQVQL